MQENYLIIAGIIISATISFLSWKMFLNEKARKEVAQNDDIFPHRRDFLPNTDENFAARETIIQLQSAFSILMFSFLTVILIVILILRLIN